MARTQAIRLGVNEPRAKRNPQHLKGPTVAFQLRDNQEVSLSAEALDAEGNKAAVTFAWATSDDTICGLTDNGDGTALVTASPGAAGLGTATISVDVTDVSDSDVHTGTFDIEVIAGDAVAVNIVAGTPTEKA